MKIIFYDASIRNAGHTFFYDYNVLTSLRESNYKVSICTNEIDEDIIPDLNDVSEEIIYFNKLRTKEKDTNNKKTSNIVQKILIDIQTKYISNSDSINKLRKRVQFLRYRKKKKDHLSNLKNIILKKQYDHLHMINIDPYLSVFKDVFKNSNCSITATLHWIPNTENEKRELKELIDLKIINTIIVHGEYLKEEIVKYIGKENSEKVISISYPIKEEEVLEEVTVSKLQDINKPVLLAFGSLRYDKGIDILLDALKNVKGKYTLIIAGAENNFTKEYILKKITKYGIEKNVYLDISFISNELMKYYFEISDIVVIPYRKIFSGQSGPLTEGINNNCIIVSSDHGQIGYTVNNEKVGISFESENINDLSRVLQNTIDNYDEIYKELLKYQVIYKEKVSISKFKSNYLSFFENL